MPREWSQTWYSPRQRAEMRLTEYTFDHAYKQYLGGQFFDLAAEPYKAKPLKVDDATGPTATAAKMRKTALDTFKNHAPPTRPRVPRIPQ